MFSKIIGQVMMPVFIKALPKIGDTERAALESGTVGYEGSFFDGKVDFSRLAAIPRASP